MVEQPGEVAYTTVLRGQAQADNGLVANHVNELHSELLDEKLGD